MESLALTRGPVSVVIAGALLCGCGANHLGVPVGSPQSALSAATLKPDGARALPPATQGDLLYVVDSGKGVYMFTYPGGAQVGLIKTDATGGLCSDKQGNVFVTDSQNSKVLEYAHGGTSPIRTLFPNAEPLFCSVDPKSGNLATLNRDVSNTASVSIFKKAIGKPKKYFDSTAVLAATCSYDNVGNLYLGAQATSQPFLIAELPKGSATFTNVSVNGSFRGGNFLQWDGAYVAVTNASPQKPVNVLQVSISGSSGTVVSTTKLRGSVGYLKYFWIQNNAIITPKGGGGWKARTIGIWKYPRGGKPISTISLPTKKAGIALGITVSVGSPR